MKKTTIWIVASVMAFSFVALLLLQLSYIEQMAKMKREQFDESVYRSLYQASRNLELNETLRFLEKDLDDAMRGKTADSTLQAKSSFQKRRLLTRPSQVPKAMLLRSDSTQTAQTSQKMQQMVRSRYLYQKSLLDEVVYNIMYTSTDRPLKERINFKLLDQDLKTELLSNGITLPYHFVVSDAYGKEVYRCPDYSDEGSEQQYTQQLFRNDNPQNNAVVTIHFPGVESYVFAGVRFMIPSIIFTIVLIVVFVFTIFNIFHQKRLTEIKNDFINNMTHELKTPISSISLAAQMLDDPAVTKSPAMMGHLSKIINDETKRLRFLVEKVLQMSMFDKKKATFKKKELDLNELLEQVAASFSLRVEHTGGKIYTEVEAVDSAIYADEVHFQNAITNLLDNAVKYRKPDQPLDIFIRTWNETGRLCFSIRDTGVGMRKEDTKKIFEKFYRVHTGNVHNVKGFGLGLAYVKKIISLHDGTISCDSEPGKGTTFTILLPAMTDNK